VFGRTLRARVLGVKRDDSRWSAEHRSRLYRRQAGRARRAELEAGLRTILGGSPGSDWRLLTLEESDPLIQRLRAFWKEHGRTYAFRHLPVDRAEVGPSAARHVARLASHERVLVFFYESEQVGLLELSAESFARASTTLIDLDGNLIAATSLGGRWGFVIDVDRNDDLEQFEMDAWDMTQAP
jgi:hypothetical protein